MKVISYGVVDHGFLGLRLAARLVFEHHVIIPSPLYLQAPRQPEQNYNNACLSNAGLAHNTKPMSLTSLTLRFSRMDQFEHFSRTPA